MKCVLSSRKTRKQNSSHSPALPETQNSSLAPWLCGTEDLSLADRGAWTQKGAPNTGHISPSNSEDGGDQDPVEQIEDMAFPGSLCSLRSLAVSATVVGDHGHPTNQSFARAWLLGEAE